MIPTWQKMIIKWIWLFFDMSKSLGLYLGPSWEL